MKNATRSLGNSLQRLGSCYFTFSEENAETMWFRVHFGTEFPCLSKGYLVFHSSDSTRLHRYGETRYQLGSH